MVNIKGGNLRKIKNDEDPYEKLIEYKNILKLFKSKQINGIKIDINSDSNNRWKKPYNSDWYKIPNKENKASKFAVTNASINTYDWLRLQASIYNNKVSKKEIDEWIQLYKEKDSEFVYGNPFLDGAYIPTVKQMEKSSETAPEPVLELNRDYSITIQEGRSRGLGAAVIGLERIPIWIAAKYK